MNWWQKICLKISRWFAPDNFQVLGVVDFAPITDEEFEIRFKQQEEWMKNNPVLLNPTKESSFSGSDVKVFIDGKKRTDVQSISMEPGNIITFCVFGQKTVEYLYSLSENKRELTLKGLNEFGNKFSITWTVEFDSNVGFFIDNNTSAISLDLRFKVVSKKDDK